MAFQVENQKLVHVSGVGAPVTLNLFSIESHHPSHHKTGEEKQFLERKEAMNRRNGPKLDLKLNLSPPRVNGPRAESPARSSPTSPPSSCVSSELNPDESSLFHSDSPEATSMMLVGCPRCLMYVMLAEDDPKCPKCKSTVLLDVVHQKNNNSSKKTMKS